MQLTETYTKPQPAKQMQQMRWLSRAFRHVGRMACAVIACSGLVVSLTAHAAGWGGAASLATARDQHTAPLLPTSMAASAVLLPTTWTVTNNADSGAGSLRVQITAAATGDSIVFAAALDGATISLTTFSNDLSTGSTQFGPSAFCITGSKTLTIDATANGLTKGVVIARSSASGTANFRLFDVGSGSSLTLRGLTLSNGAAVGNGNQFGGGSLGAGGAIFNQGMLTLQQCTLANNIAVGGFGGVSD